MLVESRADSKGNSLSSSISGFLTKDTKPADSGPKSEPEETMKIFRHEANRRSRADRMFPRRRTTVSDRDKQTRSTLWDCQHPRPVECLWSKTILCQVSLFMCGSVSLKYSRQMIYCLFTAGGMRVFCRGFRDHPATPH